MFEACWRRRRPGAAQASVAGGEAAAGAGGDAALGLTAVRTARTGTGRGPDLLGLRRVDAHAVAGAVVHGVAEALVEERKLHCVRRTEMHVRM